MLVGKRMTRNPKTVSPDDPLSFAAGILREAGSTTFRWSRAADSSESCPTRTCGTPPSASSHGRWAGGGA